MALAFGSIAILGFTAARVEWIVVRVRDEKDLLVAEAGGASSAPPGCGETGGQTAPCRTSTPSRSFRSGERVMPDGRRGAQDVALGADKLAAVGLRIG